jgi:[calcium/calmodulin-dependent protein kinase] kinase
MRHPNVVRLFSVIDDESSDKLYMILEYMSGGTLCKTVKPSRLNEDSNSYFSWSCPPVDLSNIRRKFLDVLHGLHFLHRHNVIHMDIKPDNILLDAEGNCKLSDFGVSFLINESFVRDEDVLCGVQGTPLFFAPEMLGGTTFHGKATDIWALGVTIYIALFERYPFHGVDNHALSRAIVEDEVYFPNMEGGEDLLDALRRMLCKEPALRITTHQLVSHPAFSNKVPLAWSVRLWKEKRLENCSNDGELMQLSWFLCVKDNTDRSGVRSIASDVLQNSDEYGSPRRSGTRRKTTV